MEGCSDIPGAFWVSVNSLDLVLISLYTCSIMQDSALKAAEEEAEVLRATIAQTSEARRLAVLEKFIAEYRSIEPVQRIVADVFHSRLKYGRPGSASAIVIEGTETYLRKIKRRATSREITDELKRQGIKIPGQIPNATVASYLSTSQLFDNVKGEGYGLVEWRSDDKTDATRPNGRLPLVAPNE